MKRTVLVTGGARGIGRGIADNFSADHNVAITWYRHEAQDLDEAVLAIRQDLSDFDGLEALMSAVVAKFGGIDVIVNNAAVLTPNDARNFDAQAAQDMFNVNLLVPAALLAAALPYLKNGASIVNISSVNADMPPAEASIYAASKAALNCWTRATAKEIGPLGIRINAVAPGAIERKGRPRDDETLEEIMGNTALGRVGLPDDVAKVVRFLASDEAGWITGEVLTVSGGYNL